MDFILLEDDKRYSGTLTQISNGTQLEVRRIVFTKNAVENIRSIMKLSKVNKNNQFFRLAEFVISEQDYKNLDKGKRYRAEIKGLVQQEECMVLASFVLGEIELSFDIRNITRDNNNDRHIRGIDITAYPFADYEYTIVED